MRGRFLWSGKASPNMLALVGKELLGGEGKFKLD